MSRFQKDGDLPPGLRLHRGKVVRDIDVLSSGLRSAPEVEERRERVRREHHAVMLQRLEDLLQRPGCVKSRHRRAIRPESKGVTWLAPPGWRKSFQNLIFLRDALTARNLKELLGDADSEVTEEVLVAFMQGTPKLGTLLSAVDQTLRIHRGEETVEELTAEEALAHRELWCSPRYSDKIVEIRDNGHMAQMFLEGRVTREKIQELLAQCFITEAFVADLEHKMEAWLSNETSLYAFSADELLRHIEREDMAQSGGAHRAAG